MPGSRLIRQYLCNFNSSYPCFWWLTSTATLSFTDASSSDSLLVDSNLSSALHILDPIKISGTVKKLIIFQNNPVLVSFWDSGSMSSLVHSHSWLPPPETPIDALRAVLVHISSLHLVPQKIFLYFLRQITNFKSNSYISAGLCSLFTFLLPCFLLQSDSLLCVYALFWPCPL